MAKLRELALQRSQASETRSCDLEALQRHLFLLTSSTHCLTASSLMLGKAAFSSCISVMYAMFSVISGGGATVEGDPAAALEAMSR